MFGINPGDAILALGTAGFNKLREHLHLTTDDLKAQVTPGNVAIATLVVGGAAALMINPVTRVAICTLLGMTYSMSMIAVNLVLIGLYLGYLGIQAAGGAAAVSASVVAGAANLMGRGGGKEQGTSLIQQQGLMTPGGGGNQLSETMPGADIREPEEWNPLIEEYLQEVELDQMVEDYEAFNNELTHFELENASVRVEQMVTDFELENEWTRLNQMAGDVENASARLDQMLEEYAAMETQLKDSVVLMDQTFGDYELKYPEARNNIRGAAEQMVETFVAEVKADEALVKKYEEFLKENTMGHVPADTVLQAEWDRIFNLRAPSSDWAEQFLKEEELVNKFLAEQKGNSSWLKYAAAVGLLGYAAWKLYQAKKEEEKEEVIESGITYANISSADLPEPEEESYIGSLVKWGLGF